MAQKSNFLVHFWQELKRRKVFGVVTTYAATAYIIIEVTNNLAEPLNLPPWIAKVVILLLVGGLPVVVIISWIFDFTTQGLKKTESLEELAGKEDKSIPVKGKVRASYVLNALLIIVVIILVYPKVIKQNTLEKLKSSGERISVAVMPFQNMTNDTIWNIWQDVIQSNLITFLSNNPKELKVRQPEFVSKLIRSNGLTNYYNLSIPIASSISKKLDADVFLIGSINNSLSTVRLNAQLIDSRTGDGLKSFQIDGEAADILTLIDSLSVMVENTLVISELAKRFSPDLRQFTTVTSSEAFRYFLSGQTAFNDRVWRTSAKLYSQAIEADSNFASAYIMLSMSYLNLGIYDQAKKWAYKIYQKKDKMPLYEKLMVEWIYAVNFETPGEQIIYIKQLLEIDDQAPNYHFMLGMAYLDLDEYDKAIPEYEKALEIYRKWDMKPSYTGNYSHLASLYHITGKFKKERELNKKAEVYFPDNSDLVREQAALSLSEDDTSAANDYVARYISICKEHSISEPVILRGLARIYSYAGLNDQAEEYYRKALSFQHENPELINDLAWFLIDKDRNINEGLRLINNALTITPDNFDYLDTKGWGLYKQGKYQEALKILEASWDLRRKQATYNHEAFLHLEAVRTAVTGQKNF
jgi:tetratricopeptide (TPR) repeat protein